MTADEIISRVKDLPVVSETARKLTVQLNQPDLHRDDLVQTLRHDAVLTAKILRVCNSAECGAREPVSSIDQALLILGDNAIFRLVSAIGFGECLGLTAPGYDTEANGLWAHSLSAAVGSEYPVGAESYGDYLPSTAFTAGLLHDIGKTVINKVLTPKARADIRVKIAAGSLSRVEAEKAVLGADHCEVGARLLQLWSLPEPIIEAVANHHAPVTQPAVCLSAVVYLANYVSHLAGVSPGWEAHMTQVSETAAGVLGMDVKRAEHIVSGIQAAIQNVPQLKAAA